MAIIAGLSQDTILQIGTYQNRYFEQTKVIYTVPSRVKMLNYVFSFQYRTKPQEAHSKFEIRNSKYKIRDSKFEFQYLIYRK